MQIAAGSWILDAMTVAPKRPTGRGDTAEPVEPIASIRPSKDWKPPSAEGRGLLIDLVV